MNRRTFLAKRMGKEINNAEVLCPICKVHEPNLRQPMSTIGDHEDHIFCPHCEIEFELSIVFFPEGRGE